MYVKADDESILPYGEEDNDDIWASLKTRLIKEKADRYGSYKETFRRRAVALRGRLTQ